MAGCSLVAFQGHLSDKCLLCPHKVFFRGAKEFSCTSRILYLFKSPVEGGSSPRTPFEYTIAYLTQWPRLNGGPSEGPRLHGGHLFPMVAGACPPSAQYLPSFRAGSALLPVDLHGEQGEDRAPRGHGESFLQSLFNECS